MNCDVNEQPCAQGDLSARSIAYLLWGLPALLILAGVLWPQARLWVWTPALLTAAAACVVNAARCDRLHCYFTGPLFLLAAAGTDKSRILTAQVWLADMALFERHNAAWNAWVDREHPPARACVQAALFRPELLVEIMVTAAR